MLGASIISANMDGEIVVKGKNSLILYSPSLSEKRREEFKKMKEGDKNQPEEVKEQIVNQVSMFDDKKLKKTKAKKVKVEA